MVASIALLPWSLPPPNDQIRKALQPLRSQFRTVEVTCTQLADDMSLAKELHGGKCVVRHESQCDGLREVWSLSPHLTS